MNTSMFEIFKDKLESHKKKIRKYLNNRKHLKDSEKDFLKSLIKEAKRLKNLLKKEKKNEIRCPHCQMNFHLEDE